MVKIACCYNCAFAFLDREHTRECYEAGLVNWPACANHPDAYGRMKRTPERGICPNYRPRPPVPQGETVETIPLGDGFVAYVDAADFEWLSQWTWHLLPAQRRELLQGDKEVACRNPGGEEGHPSRLFRR